MRVLPLRPARKPGKLSLMKRRDYLLEAFVLCAALMYFPAAPCLAQPDPAAAAAFNSYCAAVESRLAGQHYAIQADSGREARLRQGEQIIEKLTPSAGSEFDGAMLHHWRGTAFVSGASAADFVRLMRGFADYPKHFAPQVTEARVLASNGDHMQASMRVHQRHVIDVAMDQSYDVQFGQLDAQRGYSISHSVQIDELDSVGRPLGASREHGFLWRQNTYWNYEERDGGLYMQVESVSLSRSIPRGLGWAVGPYVESIPRESLEFTLRSVSNALRK